MKTADATASAAQEVSSTQDVQEQPTQKMWVTLLRNNAIATALTLLFGGSLMMLLMFVLGEYPAESFIEHLLGAFAGVFLAISMGAPLVYPLLAAFLLKPLPRLNFLSVIAPAALLIVVAIVDFVSTPFIAAGATLSGGFNHIALCGFCHAFGPGIFLLQLADRLAPLGGVFAPLGYFGYVSLPVLLIAAFYPSLLFYIGISLNRFWKNSQLTVSTVDSESRQLHEQAIEKAYIRAAEEAPESPNYFDPEQQEQQESHEIVPDAAVSSPATKAEPQGDSSTKILVRANNVNAIVIHLILSVVGIFAFIVLTIISNIIFPQWESYMLSGNTPWFALLPLIITVIGGMFVYVFFGYRCLKPTKENSLLSVSWLTLAMLVVGIATAIGHLSDDGMSWSSMSIGAVEFIPNIQMWLNTLGTGVHALFREFGFAAFQHPTPHPAVPLIGTPLLPPALLYIGMRLRKKDDSDNSNEATLTAEEADHS